MVVKWFPRKFAVIAFLRGRGWAVAVRVVTRCTVRTASDGGVGAVFGLMLFNCIANVAIDQTGSGLRGYLGGGDPAGERFKPLVKN